MSIKAGTRVTAALLNSLEVLSQAADKSSHTATATTSTAITTTYTIPANDASAGMVYRITFSGFGTWGATAQDMNLHVLVDGANVMSGGGNGQVAAAEFAVSTPIWVAGTLDVLIVSDGSGGTATYSLTYTVSARAKNLTGTAAQNSVTVVNMNSTSGGTTAFDTTTSHTITPAVSWASTTGAPTVTGSQSFIQRLQSV